MKKTLRAKPIVRQANNQSSASHSIEGQISLGELMNDDQYQWTAYTFSNGPIFTYVNDLNEVLPAFWLKKEERESDIAELLIDPQMVDPLDIIRMEMSLLRATSLVRHLGFGGFYIFEGDKVNTVLFESESSHPPTAAEMKEALRASFSERLREDHPELNDAEIVEKCNSVMLGVTISEPLLIGVQWQSKVDDSLAKPESKEVA